MSRAWMPLYVGDFLADTMDFDDRKTGIYLRLIMHCWQHGQIPADPEQLRIITHSSSKSWKRHCNVLDFFQRMDTQRGSYYVHSRVSIERQKYEEKQRRFSLNRGTQSQSPFKEEERKKKPSKVFLSFESEQKERKNTTGGTHAALGTALSVPPTAVPRPPLRNWPPEKKADDVLQRWARDPRNQIADSDLKPSAALLKAMAERQ